MRDPKVNPWPGDEFRAKVVKCKVLGTVADQTGLTEVIITAGHVELPYKPEYKATFSIKRFRDFVGHDTVEVFPFQEGQ